MADKWTTLKFISGFLKNDLGRKKVHGTYRVLEGDFCKLLVRATSQYGVPAGNELIAINLSNEDNRMIFWNDGYSRNFTYRMTLTLKEQANGCQVLPNLILTGNEENLLHSGIVDISPTHALIEIGDKPFLLHSDTTAEPGSGTKPRITYSHANQVPKRVPSIQEAQDQVKDPVGDRQLCKEWWAKEMPMGFKPPEFDSEYVKVLSTALNPIDYGFSMDECIIATVSGPSYGSPSFRSFVPKKKVMAATPITTKVQKWTAALTKWTEAADKLISRKPPVYKGLSTNSSRHGSLVSDEDKTGEIIVTTEGVYVLGEIHSKTDWIESDTLTQWFKLTQHANQINIPRCT